VSSNLYIFCSYDEVSRLLDNKVVYPYYKDATGFTFYISPKIPDLHKIVKKHAILVTYNGEVLKNQGAFLINYEDKWLKKNAKVLRYFTKYDRQRVLKKRNLIDQPIEEYFLPINLKFVPHLIKDIQVYTLIAAKAQAVRKLQLLKDKLQHLTDLKKQGQNIYYEDIHATEKDNV
jgi:hypothetical protein